MVYLDTLEEWQKQSALLLQARPSTARVTTKYNIPNLSSAKYQKSSKKEQDKDGSAAQQQQRVPRATLTLKTYDAVSGVNLKFKTDRAADVGRLIAGLGVLGRHMAALPPKADVNNAVAEDVLSPEPAKPTNEVPSAAATQTAGSAGGKKKKKGKK